MSISDVPVLPQEVPASLLNAGASATNLYSAPVSGARVLTVGANGEYQTIAAAIAASRDGDLIEVQAGTYVNDTADITHNITIEGVGGMVNLVETQPLANEKGIFITDASVTIANMTFSGAAIPDSEGANGAGVRYQGGDLKLINDVFTGNQNGILGSPVDGLASNTITIENSSFASNGDADPNSVGYGYTHDIYVGQVTNFTMKNSAVLGVAGVGNDVKSRANATDLEGNVISDLGTQASYSIDLPNGGNATIKGNFIEQGPNSPNQAIMEYGAESLPYAGSSLTVQGNTVVNQDLASGSVFLWNASAIVANVSGNTVSGLTGVQVASGPVQETGNVDGSGNALAEVTNTTQLSGSGNVVFTDSLAHGLTLQQSSNGKGFEGGGGLLTITAYASHLTVIGGSGGLAFTEEPQNGGSMITTVAGATDTITLSGQDTVYSQGTDTIHIGAGNATVTVNGTARVTSGAGSDSYLVNGSATVVGGGGSDFFNIGQGGTLTYGGRMAALQATSVGGKMAINVIVGGAAEQATVTGGSVTVQSYSGALNFKTAGGTLGAAMVLGVGAMNIQSFAADTIQAGSGSLMVQLNAGGARVYAGTGQLSIYARGLSSAAFLYGNGGDYLISGDSGNIVYYGGVKASTVEAELSYITLNGGAGHMTVNGGARDTITGGLGGLTVNGAAADTITTVPGSTNSLTLTGSCTVNSYGTDAIGLGSSNQILTAHGAATITGSGNNYVTLLGAETLTATGGNEQITVGAGAIATVTTAAFTMLQEARATVAYTSIAGSGNSSVTVTGGSATITSDAGGHLSVNTVAGSTAQVALGTGTATVWANGAELVTGGAGSATIDAGANGVVVRGGAGALIVNDNDYSRGDAITVYGGSGNMLLSNGGPSKMTFIGGAGQTIINGNWGILAVTGGSGALTVNGGGGGTLNFAAGSGSATVNAPTSGASVEFGSGPTSVTVAGWGPADSFHFVAGHGGGTDVINGFRVGVDQILLSGVSLTSSSLSNGVASFTLSDHTSITMTHMVGTLPPSIATLV